MAGIFTPLDGRITSQNILTGALNGDEVMEIVSPGNATSGNTYQITLDTLATFFGGGGGGGSLTITDGSNTVTGVTTLTITGATVGGTTPNATLLITGGGGSGSTLVTTLNNGGAPIIVAGSAVYLSNNVTVLPARANSISISGVVGIAFTDIAGFSAGTAVLSGILTLTPTQWQAITDGTTGLVAGTVYFLSPNNAGNLTSTAPSNPGELVVPIGRAISTTTLNVSIGLPVLL